MHNLRRANEILVRQIEDLSRRIDAIENEKEHATGDVNSNSE